jgi:tRNA modification GTPase
MSAAHATIFALSSGRLPCAIAVIRISGPDARVALERLVGRVPPPRVATFARVRDPADGSVIDEGLALWFPGPKSETGEDIAELQIHGGRAVVAAVLNALGKLEGFRHAEAGEFTRRAFDNGRLDLTAVEGLADLVAAETEAQRRQALRQMQGEFARRLDRWRGQLIEARALLEAGIDFSDEGDVPGNLAAQALGVLRPVLREIDQARQGQGERLRDGLQVVIAGAPNVGKSTLLNRLARRDVAIVSPTAGTTRDVIEVHLDLGGYPVTVRDTAGIRSTADSVEQEGVRRAEHWATASDLILWVLDAGTIDPTGIDAAAASLRAYRRPGWLVLNKCDLVNADDLATYESNFILLNLPYFVISAADGAGVDVLVAAVAAFAARSFSGESGLVTRERHRQMMGVAAHALSEAIGSADRDGVEGREELVAEQVRLATRALERLLGRVDVEDVLDVIFRDFCIGK